MSNIVSQEEVLLSYSGVGTILGDYHRRVTDFMETTKKRLQGISQDFILGTHKVSRPKNWSSENDYLLNSQSLVKMYQDISQLLGKDTQDSLVLVAGLYLTRNNGGNEEVFIVDDVFKSVGTGLQPAGGKFSQKEGPCDALVREISEELGINMKKLKSGSLKYEDIHISTMGNGKKLAICRFSLDVSQFGASNFQFGSDVTSGQFMDSPFTLSHFPSMTPQTYRLFRKNSKNSPMEYLFKRLFGNIDTNKLQKTELMKLSEVEYAFYKIYADTVSTVVKEVLKIDAQNAKNIFAWDVVDAQELLERIEKTPYNEILEKMIASMQQVYDGLKIGKKHLEIELGTLADHKVFQVYVQARLQHVLHLRNLKIISGK